MRVLDTALPLLAGLSLADAQGIDFGKIYSVKPSLSTVKPIVTSKSAAHGSSYVSSYISSLESSHAKAKYLATATSTTSAKKSTTTSTKSTTTTKSTLKTSVKQTTTSSKKATTPVATAKTSVKTSVKTTTKTSAKAAVKSAGKRAAADPSAKIVKRVGTTSSTKSSTSSSVSVSSTSTSTAPTSGCTNPSTILYNYVPNPNTPLGFGLDTSMNNTANGNWYPPAGYSTAFIGLYGETVSGPYLGYRQISSYNTSACAAYCDQVDACNAFNIFYERTPVYVPNDNCSNPNAAAAVGCGLYGAYLDNTTATNLGQYRNDFLINAQGSNGYNQNTPPPAVANFTGPTALYAAVNSNVGFLNSSFSATYDVNFCYNQCTSLTAQNRAASISAKNVTYTRKITF